MDKILAEYDQMTKDIDNNPNKVEKFGPLNGADPTTQFEKIIRTRYFDEQGNRIGNGEWDNPDSRRD